MMPYIIHLVFVCFLLLLIIILLLLLFKSSLLTFARHLIPTVFTSCFLFTLLCRPHLGEQEGQDHITHQLFKSGN